MPHRYPYVPIRALIAATFFFPEPTEGELGQRKSWPPLQVPETVTMAPLKWNLMLSWSQVIQQLASRQTLKRSRSRGKNTITFASDMSFWPKKSSWRSSVFCPFRKKKHYLRIQELKYKEILSSFKRDLFKDRQEIFSKIDRHVEHPSLHTWENSCDDGSYEEGRYSLSSSKSSSNRNCDWLEVWERSRKSSSGMSSALIQSLDIFWNRTMVELTS